MYVDFDQLSDESRIWIFQSPYYLEDEKMERISAQLINFLDQWTAHGQGLKASFDLKFNHFIIIGLDRTGHQASGCSIDKLNHQMQALERELNVSLLDPTKIAFRNDEGLLQFYPLAAFRDALETGELDEHTTVYNNLIETKGQLADQWEVPLHASWHRQWLPVA